MEEISSSFNNLTYGIRKIAGKWSDISDLNIFHKIVCEVMVYYSGCFTFKSCWYVYG